MKKSKPLLYNGFLAALRPFFIGTTPGMTPDTGAG
jgi:hypothetical protein